MDKIFNNEDEPVKKCPTCGAEVIGISETFNADGKKISTEDYFDTSHTNEKEHKFALKEEEEKEEYTPEELNVEQSLADHAEKFKIKD
jgi:hypothetical protein